MTDGVSGPRRRGHRIFRTLDPANANGSAPRPIKAAKRCDFSAKPFSRFKTPALAPQLLPRGARVEDYPACRDRHPVPAAPAGECEEANLPLRIEVEDKIDVRLRDVVATGNRAEKRKVAHALGFKAGRSIG